nr:hypothetical protein CFP56_73225 [Quercus suber]
MNPPFKLRCSSSVGKEWALVCALVCYIPLFLDQASEFIISLMELVASLLRYEVDAFYFPGFSIGPDNSTGSLKCLVFNKVDRLQNRISALNCVLNNGIFTILNF